MLFSKRDKLTLRALSENSRIGLSTLAKQLNCSHVTAGKIINKLKETFDIRFTLELDMLKLGFVQQHILEVSFSKKPDINWLKSIFKEDSKINTAYLTEGQFDLIVIAEDNNPINYLLWEFKFMQQLSDYSREIRSSNMPYFIFGYMPRENISVKELDIIDKKDLSIINLLAKDSRMDYTEIARRIGLGESSIRYKVSSLVKKGIIKRFTIAVQNPPQQYILAMFENWLSFSKNFGERADMERNHMLKIDEEFPLLNKFQVAAPLTGSFGNFIIGLFDSYEDAFDNVVKKHKEFYKTENYIEKHARIKTVIKGMLPIRNLDIKTNYNFVDWR